MRVGPISSFINWVRSLFEQRTSKGGRLKKTSSKPIIQVLFKTGRFMQKNEYLRTSSPVTPGDNTTKVGQISENPLTEKDISNLLISGQPAHIGRDWVLTEERVPKEYIPLIRVTDDRIQNFSKDVVPIYVLGKGGGVTDFNGKVEDNTLKIPVFGLEEKSYYFDVSNPGKSILEVQQQVHRDMKREGLT